MTTNHQNETLLPGSNGMNTRLQALTPTEMLEVQGGRDGGVHCYESPNKVIDEYAVWYEVPCDSGRR